LQNSINLNIPFDSFLLIGRTKEKGLTIDSFNEISDKDLKSNSFDTQTLDMHAIPSSDATACLIASVWEITFILDRDSPNSIYFASIVD